MNTQTACLNMIKQQLRTGDILDQNILDLFVSFPREKFAPESLKPYAYSDIQLKLDHDQRMMTPLEEASLLSALALKGHETVLEVGTGTGFLTALLSQRSKHVISVDYFEDFTKQAKKNLDQFDIKNVELVTGDASRGWLDKAPFDIVVFTAAMEKITDTHRLQVLPGGKLFVIVGKEPIMNGLLYTLDHSETWSRKLVFETCIPALIDKTRTNDFVF